MSLDPVDSTTRCAVSAQSAIPAPPTTAALHLPAPVRPYSRSDLFVPIQLSSPPGVVARGKPAEASNARGKADVPPIHKSEDEAAVLPKWPRSARNASVATIQSAQSHHIHTCNSAALSAATVQTCTRLGISCNTGPGSTGGGARSSSLPP